LHGQGVSLSISVEMLKQDVNVLHSILRKIRDFCCVDLSLLRSLAIILLIFLAIIILLVLLFLWIL